MTPTDQSQTKPHPRGDGWTPPRRVAFLEAIAGGFDVRRACARVGLSRQAAYKLRRRDAGFARAWNAALRAARANREWRFPELPAEQLPWARSFLSAACQFAEGEKRAQRMSPVSRV